MFDEVVSWIGFALSILFLLWVLQWFLREILPELISNISYYAKNNRKLVTILSAVATALALFLFKQNQLTDIVAASIMIILSIPLLIFFIAVLLELVKSPYADMVGDLFFRLKEPMAIGTIFFMIGCFIFLTLNYVV